MSHFTTHYTAFFNKEQNRMVYKWLENEDDLEFITNKIQHMMNSVFSCFEKNIKTDYTRTLTTNSGGTYVNFHQKEGSNHDKNYHNMISFNFILVNDDELDKDAVRIEPRICYITTTRQDVCFKKGSDYKMPLALFEKLYISLDTDLCIKWLNFEIKVYMEEAFISIDYNDKRKDKVEFFDIVNKSGNGLFSENEIYYQERICSPSADQIERMFYLTEILREKFEYKRKINDHFEEKIRELTSQKEINNFFIDYFMRESMEVIRKEMHIFYMLSY